MLEILGIIVIVIIAIGTYIIIDRCIQKDKVGMSFRESMDLVDLPVITFYNNGNKFNFLLDTGATSSVINSSVLNTLSYQNTDRKGVVFGMEGNTVHTEFIKALLEYKDKKFECDFQVVDMSCAFDKVKAESGVSLSGILGSLFFKKYQYILDFNSLIAYSKK